MFYFSLSEEANARRSLQFWGSLYPIYAHYRFTQVYTHYLQYTEQETDAAFQSLHEKYQYAIYNIIVSFQGFYIKLGQMGAARTDIIPEQWVKQLRKLEDECPSQSYEVIQQIIENDFGCALSDLFSEFDPMPLGSASIGQAHYARLKSDNSEVCVKVQYPNVEKLFRGDFEMARTFCEMVQPAHLPFLDETRKQFLTEFDYRLEAQNLAEIASNLNQHPLWKEKVRVPEPYLDYCKKNTLTMEYLAGDKLITALKKNFTAVAHEQGLTLDEFKEQQKQTPWNPTAKEMKHIHAQIERRDYVWNILASVYNHTWGYIFYALGHKNHEIVPYKHTTLPLNTKLILDIVSDVHGYEIFINGAFNGDPHPGNILLMDDGRLGLIDYGQVKHLSVDQRILLASLMVHLSRNDTERVRQSMVDMGFRTKRMDPWVIETSARFFFDADDESVTEGLNAQMFLEMLNKRDKITCMADDYVMFGRLKMLLSGLYHSLGYRFSASDEWLQWSQQVLIDNNISI